MSGHASESVQKIQKQFCLVSLGQIPGFLATASGVFEVDRGLINFPPVLIESNLHLILRKMILFDFDKINCFSKLACCIGLSSPGGKCSSQEQTRLWMPVYSKHRWMPCKELNILPGIRFGIRKIAGKHGHAATEEINRSFRKVPLTGGHLWKCTFGLFQLFDSLFRSITRQVHRRKLRSGE